MSLSDALSRTLLLMRGDLDSGVEDAQLLDALTSVRVVLNAGADALATHSGQTALVSAALTMARSGHEVWIAAEEVAMLGAQPPLNQGPLLQALADAGDDLLPGRSIRIGAPLAADLAVTFGQAKPLPYIDRTLAIDATDWAASLGEQPGGWSGGAWPLGAVAAGILVASEAFRIAVRKLAPHAALPAYFEDLHAPVGTVSFVLAPDITPKAAALPDFDIISGGAIANAALFALSRIPGITGKGRVLDDDRSALSNLNRNALLRRSALDEYKVADLARLTGTIVLSPEPVRYLAGMTLADHVLVGVDDIPSRWAAQAQTPHWLGVGATEGFSVLVSSHAADQACAGCLHPVAAAPTGPIPTAAFVSLLSGLLLAVRWLRALGPEGSALPDQQQFLNALRPEGWSFGAMPLHGNPACPVGCAASQMRNAA